MVIDLLKNMHLYEGLNERFKKAFTYLKETDFLAIESGKYEIEGDNIFAIVNEFVTKNKNECEAEAHKKHIDIQYLVSGTELFGYAPLTNQQPIIGYDETKDVAIYKEEMSYIKLEAGMFMIFYPGDLHQPEMRVLEPVTVKKVVVKIKI
jgi:YhcH/YjgK/YiaL family protein